MGQPPRGPDPYRVRPGSTPGDRTVADADGIRDVYASAVGWKPEPRDMGGDADLEASLARCTALGGIQLTPVNGDPGPAGAAYRLIEDLAGAVLAPTRAGQPASAESPAP